jgi:hypothetical protein
VSDLAEIAMLCAIERGIEIAVIVDPAATGGAFMGRPVVASFAAIGDDVDGVLLTDLKAPQKVFDAAREHVGVQKILAPRLLRISAEAPAK